MYRQTVDNVNVTQQGEKGIKDGVGCQRNVDYYSIKLLFDFPSLFFFINR